MNFAEIVDKANSNFANEYRNDARPCVNQYVAKAFGRPGFRSGVPEWPGAYGPSPHVPEFSGMLALPKFILEMRRRG